MKVRLDCQKPVVCLHLLFWHFESVSVFDRASTSVSASVSHVSLPLVGSKTKIKRHAYLIPVLVTVFIIVLFLYAPVWSLTG